jgi:hypothetical protein
MNFAAHHDAGRHRARGQGFDPPRLHNLGSRKSPRFVSAAIPCAAYVPRARHARQRLAALRHAEGDERIETDRTVEVVGRVAEGLEGVVKERGVSAASISGGGLKVLLPNAFGKPMPLPSTFGWSSSAPPKPPSARPFPSTMK